VLLTERPPAVLVQGGFEVVGAALRGGARGLPFTLRRHPREVALPQAELPGVQRADLGDRLVEPLR
jgi:hypothetical protein